MSPDLTSQLSAIAAEQHALRERIGALDRRIVELQSVLEAQTQAVTSAAPDREISSPASIPVPAGVPPSLPPALNAAAVLSAPAAVTIPSSQTAAGSPPGTVLPAATKAVASSAPTVIAPAATEPFELMLGSYWLVRIGIVVLLTGLVFLGNYVYKTYIPHLGPAGKLTMLYLAGGGLLGAGMWFEHWRIELKNYARVLQAGGLATIYYTTYAAHFVPRLRVIESPLIGGILLLVLAGMIGWIAERRRSQTIALLVVLLSYYTAAMNPLHGFSLFSNLLLTAVAVFFLIRHGWARLTYASLIGSYVGFGFWRLYQSGEFVWGTGLDPSEFWISRMFLLSYWLLFTVGFFVTGTAQVRPGARALCLLVNNAAFYAYTAPSFHRLYPENLWQFNAMYGATLLGLAALSRWRFRNERVTEGSYLAQGIAVVSLAIIAKAGAVHLPLYLAMESFVLVFVSRQIPRQQLVLRVGAAAAAVLSLALELPQILEGDSESQIAIMLLAMSAVFAVNAWLVRQPRAAGERMKWDWESASYALLMTLCLMLGVARYFYANRENWPSDRLWMAVTLTAALVVMSALQRWLRTPEIAVISRLLVVPAFVAAMAHFEDGRNAYRSGIVWIAIGMVAAASALRHSLPAETSKWVRRVGVIDLAAALALYLIWGLDRLPSGWHLTFLTASGMTLLLLGIWRRWRGLLFFGALTLTLGLCVFGLKVLEDSTSRGDWLAPVLLIMTQQFGRRLAGERHDLFSKIGQGIMLTAAGLCGLALVTEQSPAAFITVGWSCLGCVFFALGFALRERLLRLFGLATLAAAVVRVFLRDVWHLDTAARILSFLVLGAVLLGLGFVYNRYHQRIRRWL